MNSSVSRLRSDPFWPLYFSVPLIPVLVAGLLVWWLTLARGPALFPVPMLNLGHPSSAELGSIFIQHSYHWPPPPEVPRLAVNRLPGDLDDLPAKQRKTLFLRILLPLVLAENRRIMAQRKFLQQTFAKGRIIPETPTGKKVLALAASYKTDGDINTITVRDKLLRRVDSVPVALVLAQAAQESGWGTSRFAREANNLFGVWTWDETAGVVPKNRAADARHLVRAFPSIRMSIRSYLHNINIGFAYQALREMRSELRKESRKPDALELAGTLLRYSSRGPAYVEDIRTMIIQNNLQQLADITLEQSNG